MSYIAHEMMVYCFLFYFISLVEAASIDSRSPPALPLSFSLPPIEAGADALTHAQREQEEDLS